MKNKQTQLKMRLKTYDDVKGIEYTETQLIEAGVLNDQYNKGKQIVSKFGIEYNKESIENAIEKAQILIKINRLRPLILKCKVDVEVAEYQSTTEIDEQIMLAQLSANVLKCPHCDNSVRFMDGYLHVSSTAKTSPMQLANLFNNKEKIIKNNQQYERWKKAQSDYEELKKAYDASQIPISLEELKIKIQEYPIVPESAIYELKSVVCIDNLPDISKIKRVLEKNKLVAELETLVIQEEGEMEEGNINDYTIKLKQYNQRRSQCQLRLIKYDESVKIKEHLDVLRNQVNEKYKENIVRMESEIENYTKQISTILRYDEFYEKRSKLELSRTELVELHKHLTLLTRLKEIAIEVECHSLQQTVDSINNIINDIAPLLFDDPITIRLNLFKQIKSKDRLKPTVNMVIYYRGGEYDNINQLSGGEGDRVSLILTLALSRLSSFPCILLDESLSALDGQLKEMATKAIRLNTNKTVVCINHEGTEGYYDHQMVL